MEHGTGRSVRALQFFSELILTLTASILQVQQLGLMDAYVILDFSVGVSKRLFFRSSRLNSLRHGHQDASHHPRTRSIK